MKLVHYSGEKLEGKPYYHDSPISEIKPNGFWVSDDDCEDNWKTWCEGEDFRLDRLKYRYEIKLYKNNKIQIITNNKELQQFSYNFAKQSIENITPWYLDWNRVKELYDGVIITPHMWDVRLDYIWYSIWDCASGVIWNMNVIKSYTLLTKDE